MFSKVLIALASATLIATATAPAYAGEFINGGGENGREMNGGGENGVSMQGTATGASRLAIDGIELPAAMR